eukprot:736608-Prymnesium_polylepis.1
MRAEQEELLVALDSALEEVELAVVRQAHLVVEHLLPLDRCGDVVAHLRHEGGRGCRGRSLRALHRDGRPRERVRLDKLTVDAGLLTEGIPQPQRGGVLLVR